MTVRQWDRAAAGYDDVATSALGTALRARVHARVAELLTPGADVLDLGCGTGIDAAWLGGRGARVVALDASPAMVTAAAERIGRHGIAVEHDLDRDPLVTVAPRGVDLVLSNFGVINCLADLDRFGRQVADVLRDDGHAVIVTMAKYCPTEVGERLFRGRFRGASDRGRNAVAPAAAPLEGTVRYHSGRSLAAQFTPALELVRTEAIGTVLPTFEQRRFVDRRPRLLSALDRVDRAIARPSARLGLGDHQLAVFRKRPQ